jgi:hypothetical protein
LVRLLKMSVGSLSFMARAKRLLLIGRSSLVFDVLAIVVPRPTRGCTVSWNPTVRNNSMVAREPLGPAR